MGVIGCLLEGFTVMISGFALNAVVTTIFSLLIVFVATARWNFWGLVLCPILPLATIVGGMNSKVATFAPFYDWRVYVAITASLLVVGLINTILFKREGVSKIISSPWMMIALEIINYIVFNIVLIGIYYLCVLPVNGQIIYNYKIVVDGVSKDASVNVCNYIRHAYLYNLFSLAIMIIGSVVLRSQGVIVNVHDKLIEDRKNAELIRENTNNFEIPEESATDESSDTNDSSGN